MKFPFSTYSSYSQSQRSALAQSNSMYSMGVLFGAGVSIMTSASVLMITPLVVYVSSNLFTTLQYIFSVSYFWSSHLDLARSAILEFNEVAYCFFMKE